MKKILLLLVLLSLSANAAIWSDGTWNDGTYNWYYLNLGGNECSLMCHADYNRASVVIPEIIDPVGLNLRVVAIHDTCFFANMVIEEVVIPNSVRTIETTAFDSCVKLKSINIPNSVTSIGTHSFDGCSALATVTIGTGITTIGDDCFKSCSSLTNLVINAPVAPSVNFNNNPSTNNCTICIPVGGIGYDDPTWQSYPVFIIPEPAFLGLFALAAFWFIRKR